MAHNRRSGKLAVILHADVVGSTALVQKDEQLAHERILETFRRFGGTITKYHGHIRELRGDALLAEFERASDAVTAALAFQAEQIDDNAQLSDEIRPTVRVGIAMGEVIIADDTITGAGVVLAQRLEQLSEPGGVVIQGAAYETIPGRFPFEYTDQGEHEVKGFDKPVRVYSANLKGGADVPQPSPLIHRSRITIIAVASVAVIIVGIALMWFKPWEQREEPGSVERMAFPLPDKPSIAVLAFNNLSGDPDQEYLSDGITESLITRLARQPDMFVIARNSSFTYKGKPVKVQQVGRELGVRYVLEGSVQKAGESIRITAQLIEAATAEHLWADSYDRELEDLFAVQDEITQKVAIELAVKLTVGEGARSDFQATDNVEAYEYWLRGVEAYRLFRKETNVQAGELFEKAIELDPQYARAIGWLGWVRLNESRFWWVEDRDQSFEQAEELARRAVAIDENSPGAHSLLARIYSHKGLHEEAIAEGQRTVAIEPSSAPDYSSLAWTMVLAGRPEDGLVLIKKALRLSPYPPVWFRNVETNINYQTGRYEAAITSGRKLLDRTLEGGQARNAWKLLIASYVELGREAEARAEADKFLENYPDFSVKEEAEWRKDYVYKDKSWIDRFIETLRTAGLPE